MFNPLSNLLGSDSDSDSAEADGLPAPIEEEETAPDTLERDSASPPTVPDSDDSSEYGPGSSGSGTTKQSSKYSDIEYAVELDDESEVVQMGRQLMVEDVHGNGPYAGQWPRNMFESARENPKQATWIGYRNNPRTGLREVPIAHNSWFRHAAVFGTTGYGKTTLLNNIMLQWAYSGHGFCFIDPKGDGVVELLQRIPKERLDDVIWIEPTPNNDTDRIVGINFLEAGADPGSQEYEQEVESIVDDLESILKDESYWGPKMGGVLRNIARGMIKSDTRYTLIDMYYVLLNEDYLEMFAEDVDDDLAKRYTRVIAEEMDQSDLDPLIRRLQDWVENQIAREIVSHRESTVNIKQAVEEGKIILVKNDVDSEKIKRVISTGVMRRVWAAIKARDALDEDEDRDPYFMIIDEFDDVVSEEANVDKMLSKARSLGMSVTLCCQQPSQLPQAIRKAIFGNCDNLMALNPNEPGDARHIMRRFGDYEDTDLLNLGKFKMFTRIMVGSEQSDPFVTKTYPDYPPLRNLEETKKVIRKTLERYGVERLDSVQKANDVALADAERDDEGGIIFEQRDDLGTETTDTPDSGASPASADADGSEESVESTDEIPQDVVLECILARQLRSDEDFVPLDDVRDELENRLKRSDIGYSSLSSNVFERLPEKLAKKQRRDGENVIRLTSAGKSEVFKQDTGSSASGGSDEHRYVLRRAFETFTRAGFIVDLPSQEGDELPDGVADLPIDMAASSYKEAQKKMDRLEDEYPDVAGVSEGRDLNIEAETNTIEYPSQTIKNLRKALREDRKCIFAVKDMASKENKDLEYHAEIGLGIMTDPVCVSEEKNGQKRYYSNSHRMEVEDSVYAIRPKHLANRTQWWDLPGGGIALTKQGHGVPDDPDEDGVLLSFNSKDTVSEPRPTDVPAYYEYDRSQSAYIVTAKERIVEEVVDTQSERDKWSEAGGKNKLRRKYADKDEFKSDWSSIHPPLVPEVDLPRMPDEDDWMFVIFPDDNRDLPPLKYEYNGTTDDGEIQAECVPLLKSDREEYDTEEVQQRVAEINNDS